MRRIDYLCNYICKWLSVQVFPDKDYRLQAPSPASPALHGQPGKLKNPCSHLSQRAGHGVPGVVFWPCLTGWCFPYNRVNLIAPVERGTVKAKCRTQEQRLPKNLLIIYYLLINPGAFNLPFHSNLQCHSITLPTHQRCLSLNKKQEYLYLIVTVNSKTNFVILDQSPRP